MFRGGPARAGSNASGAHPWRAGPPTRHAELTGPEVIAEDGQDLSPGESTAVTEPVHTRDRTRTTAAGSSVHLGWARPHAMAHQERQAAGQAHGAESERRLRLGAYDPSRLEALAKARSTAGLRRFTGTPWFVPRSV
jgi:hypothetical protein